MEPADTSKGGVGVLGNRYKHLLSIIFELLVLGHAVGRPFSARVVVGSACTMAECCEKKGDVLHWPGSGGRALKSFYDQYERSLGSAPDMGVQMVLVD